MKLSSSVQVSHDSNGGGEGFLPKAQRGKIERCPAIAWGAMLEKGEISKEERKYGTTILKVTKEEKREVFGHLGKGEGGPSCMKKPIILMATDKPAKGPLDRKIPIGRKHTFTHSWDNRGRTPSTDPRK